MSVVTYRYTEFGCDKCGKSLRCHTCSEKHAIAWAREDGWSVGKEVLCPDCRPGHQVQLGGEE